MAKSSDASVGMEPAGTTASGRKIAAMEKPLATRTLSSIEAWLPTLDPAEAELLSDGFALYC